MQHDSRSVLLRVDDLGAATWPADRADVADLASRLGVERSLVDDDDAFLPFPRSSLFSVEDLEAVAPRAQRAQNLGIRELEALVADELRGGKRTEPGQNLLERPEALLAVAGGGAGAFALAGDRLLEAGLVDRELLLFGDLAQQLDRQAVGVVQAEDLLARKLAAAGALGLLDPLLHHPRADRHGVEELLLLRPDGRRRGRLGRLELAVGPGHRFVDDRQEPAEERGLETEAHAVTHRPPEQAAQHVATPVVGGNDAIGEQESGGAEVVGDHPQGGVVLGVAPVGFAGEGRRAGENRLEEIGVVVRVDAGDHRRHPFQPGAGVDRRFRQRRQHAARGALVLHEDEVPDLEIAPAVGTLVPTHLRQIGPAIDVDLAARTAGTGLPHCPEVVLLAAAHDPTGREPRDLQPERRSLVVLLVDRSEEMGGREAPDPGDQLPGELDRLRLEVVAEGEVAEHLEEGVVARRRSDVLEVVVLAGYPQALLHRDGARVFGGRGAGEVVLELDHAGVGEEEGRVAVRHERRARHGPVTAVAEIVDETLADLGAAHRFQGAHSAHSGLSRGKAEGGGAFQISLRAPTRQHRRCRRRQRRWRRLASSTPSLLEP